MSYKKLQVWQEANKLVIDIHRLSLALPVYERYEVGSQIRRSAKSIKSNIVEGYGRRDYKKEFSRFISYAIASTDETVDHLETLVSTGSLPASSEVKELHTRLNTLGKKLIVFKRAIQKKHISPK